MYSDFSDLQHHFNIIVDHFLPLEGEKIMKNFDRKNDNLKTCKLQKLALNPFQNTNLLTLK